MRSAVLVIVGLVCAARAARARPYETFVDVTTEDELYDLDATGAIDDDELDELDELLARGVDLNAADREGLYQLPNLTYADVDAILAARAARAARGGLRGAHDLDGVIDDDKLRAIAAFVVVRGPGAHGFALAQTRWSQDDRGAPATMARARLYVGEHITAGVGAILTRQRLGPATWDPTRDGGVLLAAPPGTGVEVPKAYVRWQDDRVDAIAGSYRVGFGERLTFDDSYDETPNGLYADDQIVHGGDLVLACKEGAGELGTSPCSRDAPTDYVSPDYTVREGLFGAAVRARAIELERGWIEATAWASYHRRSVYQYALYDASRCADPRGDAAACAAPAVLVRPGGDGLAPTASFAYETVPDVFREALVGANATYALDRRTRVGVTGFGARTLGLIAGADLGYQEWANRPGATGDDFGAIGASAAWGARGLDVGAEVARSLDGMRPAPGALVHGGGGDAGLVTATATSRRDVLEASLRWYGVDFVDPYAKPIAERDELEGEPARDEAGARLRYTGRRGRLAVRAQLDAWALPAEHVPRTNDWLRLDDGIDAPIGWGLWLQFEDKDLAQGGRGQCFDSGADPDAIGGAPSLCKGMRVSTTARLHLNPSSSLRVTAQLTHRLLDDPRHPDGFRHDVMAWALVLYRPSERVRIDGRARYLFEDVATPGYLEESLWVYGDVAVRVRGRDAVRVRADVYDWLDARASTARRSPNPELRLWLEYEADF